MALKPRKMHYQLNSQQYYMLIPYVLTVKTFAYTAISKFGPMCKYRHLNWKCQWQVRQGEVLGPLLQQQSGAVAILSANASAAFNENCASIG